MRDAAKIFSRLTESDMDKAEDLRYAKRCHIYGWKSFDITIAGWGSMHKQCQDICNSPFVSTDTDIEKLCRRGENAMTRRPKSELGSPN